MARKRIFMNRTVLLEQPLHREQVKKDGFVIGDFLRLHEQFMTVKKLEGLAVKTIEDHLKFMRYFSDWMKDDVKDYENRFVQKGIFLEYIAYMYSGVAVLRGINLIIILIWDKHAIFVINLTDGNSIVCWPAFLVWIDANNVIHI